MTFADQRFVNGRVQGAQIGVGHKPEVMDKAVIPVEGGYGKLKQYLLSPAERQAIMRTEAQEFRARGTLKTAELQRRRLVHLLRDRHPQGALRVDGVENPESQIYGDRAAVRIAKEQRHLDHVARRRERITSITTAPPRLGFDPFAHNEDWLDPTKKNVRFMQCKTRRPPPQPAHFDQQDDSHDRLFGSSPAKTQPGRTQHLRNEDLGGKKYNPVHGGKKYEYWPATIPERRHDQSFMTHPSQVSLDLPRSLQGAVPLGDRTTGMVIF